MTPPLVCAVYARKSTEQTGVADEAKSVARQVAQARAFAAARGWTVDDAHVYSDDGISGAEFANRPGYVRLLNALKPRAPFDALIVSELSRLGREQLEAGYGLKQLAQAGVQVYSYLEGREIRFETAVDKFVLSAVTFAAEVEREKAQQRTRDAMTRKARAGHLCGGACYGYRNVPVVGPDGQRSHVDRRVHEPEAAVVRRIFALCARGHGMKAVTKMLNAERVAAPRPQRGRPCAWAPSSVRAVLFREAYRGVYTYGVTQQSDQWGQRKVVRRPEGEVVRTRVEGWRIVSDAEWAAAHRRLDAAKRCYVRATNGRVWGRPPSGLASKYLLSGLLRCAQCGASMTIRSRAHGRRRFFYYTCANYDHRGETVCGNGLLLPVDRADAAIVAKIAQLLDPDTVQGAITDALARLRPSPEVADARRASLRKDLAAVDAEQARVAEAIAVAGHVEALATALRDREQRRARLQAELAAMAAADPGVFDAPRVARELRRRVEEWRALVGRQTPIARQALDRLLADRIAWTPDVEKGEYRYTGRLRFDRLLSGIVSTLAFPQGMASPTAVDPSREADAGVGIDFDDVLKVA